MTKRKTSIHINGQHYDALTGVALSFEATPAPTNARIKSIDGVVGGVTSHTHKPGAALHVAAPKPAQAAKPATARIVAAHACINRSKPSQTLMRGAVKKPTASSLKRSTKVQSRTVHQSAIISPSLQAAIVPKHSVHSVSAARSKRASTAQKSQKIARYGHQLAVKVEREAVELASLADAAFVVPKTFSPDIVYQPTPLTKQQQRTSDIFEQALLRATTHEEVMPNLKTKRGRKAALALRRRMVSFTAGAVAVLAIMGAFGFHQNSNSQFHTAVSQAGFAATLPAYHPDGFKLADVTNSGGYLSIRYKSDLHSFAVVEKRSSLDNGALLNQIQNSPTGEGYVALNNDTTTVYVYGRNQAAWVNNGILYQVLGNGALSDQQFSQIAASM